MPINNDILNFLNLKYTDVDECDSTTDGILLYHSWCNIYWKIKSVIIQLDQSTIIIIIWFYIEFKLIAFVVKLWVFDKKKIKLYKLIH